MSETRSLINSKKDRLLGQLLTSIDRELLGRGERPVKYEVVYYKDKIPKDREGKTLIVTAIPEPDPLLEELKNIKT